MLLLEDAYLKDLPEYVGTVTVVGLTFRCCTGDDFRGPVIAVVDDDDLGMRLATTVDNCRAF